MNAALQQTAEQAIHQCRAVLGLKESRKAEYWAGLDSRRKAGYLRLARVWNSDRELPVLTDWHAYTGQQHYAIEQAMKTAAQRAFDDAFFMGAIRGVRRPEAC